MIEEKIEQSLTQLEGAFGAFQEKQAALVKEHVQKQRPAMGRITEGKESSGFINYLKSGDLMYTKSLTSSTDTGNLLLPEAVRDRVSAQLTLQSALRSLCRVTQISSDTLEVLTEKAKPDAGWVNETDERDETNAPELHKIKIPVHYLYAKPRISQKLMDDSAIDLESWLAQSIADKMASLESQGFIYGDGENKPRGFLTLPQVPVGKGDRASIETLRTGEQGAILSPEVLFKALESLKACYLKNAVWVMSRTAMAAVRQLKDHGNMLWQPSLALGTPDTLLGYPVIICDEMPALNPGKVSSPIAFGDFSKAYQIVDRQGIQILRDPYSAKPYVEFYVTKRVGGDVIDADALKLIVCDEAL